MRKTNHITELLFVVLVTASGCVSDEAWHREDALLQWTSSHENQRPDLEAPLAVKYVASFGLGPNVNAFRSGKIAATRPSAPPASYLFSVPGYIFPHAPDRVVVFEVEFFPRMKVASTAYALWWQNGKWQEDWRWPEIDLPATNP